MDFKKKLDTVREVFPDDPAIAYLDTAERAFDAGDKERAIGFVSEAIAELLSSKRNRAIVNDLNELMSLLKKA